jgi:hypothetical protein
MRIRKFICAAVLAAFVCASVGGCYGKYALFNKVHKWNGKIGDKWINSVVHFVFFGILPVYGICLFADFLIFNTIEFWTGSNPVAMNSDTYHEIDENGNEVFAVRNTDGSLSVSMTDVSGNKTDFTLVNDGNIIRAVDTKGEAIASQIVGNDGEIVAQVAVK